MSGKYFPNNVDAIRDAPDDVFQECSWEEFHDWRLMMWELPASVSCIIRAEHKESGKISEHVYQQPKAAHKRLMKYMKDGMYNVIVANHEAIHLVKITDEPDSD